MRASMLFFLCVLPSAASAQLDSIHLLCPCSAEDIGKAANDHDRFRYIGEASYLGRYNWLLHLSRDGQSYFFRTDKAATVGYFLNRDKPLPKKLFIHSVGRTYADIRMKSTLDSYLFYFEDSRWVSPTSHVLRQGESLGSERE